MSDKSEGFQKKSFLEKHSNVVYSYGLRRHMEIYWVGQIDKKLLKGTKKLS